MFWSAALLRRFFSPTKHTKITQGFRHVKALKTKSGVKLSAQNSLAASPIRRFGSCLSVSSAQSAVAAYSRVALNAPCFDGLSPTSGANSTSPLIESGVWNFPLNINVPASRPTFPSGNSTAPENVTEF